MKPLTNWPRIFSFFLGLILFAPGARAHTAAEEMADAANHFLAALNPDQKAKAHFDLKADERQNWHFIPKDRNGLPMKGMTSAQKLLAQSLLASGLSQRGYVKATTIMSLEQVLAEMEGPNRHFPRDPELYYVSIFGNPGAKETWGWRVEGHHVSINFTIVKGEFISATPSFLGSNPAEVKEGPRKGLRVLAAEEDLGRQLVKSLDADQRKVAIIAVKAPAEIITGADRKVKALEPVGLAVGQMNDDQKQILKKLIHEYVYRDRPEVADKDLAKIREAGPEKILFAWAGGVEPGQGHYYRIQGPTFLMEYDCTQNNANHIHAVWRDFESDFGEDLLREHYDQVPHHQ
jgi:Protein of unknown function (DUF3500)